MISSILSNIPIYFQVTFELYGISTEFDSVQMQEKSGPGTCTYNAADTKDGETAITRVGRR